MLFFILREPYRTTDYDESKNRFPEVVARIQMCVDECYKAMKNTNLDQQTEIMDNPKLIEAETSVARGRFVLSHEMYPQALEYFQSAFDTMIEMYGSTDSPKDSRNLMTFYADLAFCHENLEHYIEAIDFNEKALSEHTKSKGFLDVFLY